MNDLDAIDRKLIAHLRLDGRASVTTLAGTLGIARGTVQTRLARLVANGTIRRFTVEVEAPGAPDLVQAIMLIEIKGNLEKSVRAQLRRMPQIGELHTTNGAWDLVAHLQMSSLAEFDRVLRQIRELPGVLNSETCLLLDRAL